MCSGVRGGQLLYCVVINVSSSGEQLLCYTVCTGESHHYPKPCMASELFFLFAPDLVEVFCKALQCLSAGLVC